MSSLTRRFMWMDMWKYQCSCATQELNTIRVVLGFGCFFFMTTMSVVRSLKTYKWTWLIKLLGNNTIRRVCSCDARCILQLVGLFCEASLFLFYGRLVAVSWWKHRIAWFNINDPGEMQNRIKKYVYKDFGQQWTVQQDFCKYLYILSFIFISVH